MRGSWSVCGGCGSVVADEALHREHHGRIAARLGEGTPASGGQWAGAPVVNVAPVTTPERDRLDADRAALRALAATSQAAHTPGAPWVAPEGAHDAYAKGATVAHGGKRWESLAPFNVWTPGVSGWREVVAEGFPAWVQPTGAHDAYAKGTRVSFNGANYESTIDANTWSPTAYPAGWLRL